MDRAYALHKAKVQADTNKAVTKKSTIIDLTLEDTNEVATKSSAVIDLTLTDNDEATETALSPTLFNNLCEYRKEWEWADFRQYSKPMSHFHPIAFKLGNSVPSKIHILHNVAIDTDRNL